MNAKVKRVFIIFVITPILLAMLNWLFSGRYFLSWAYYRTNEISMIALAISFFGSLLVVYFNYRLEKRRIWYVISIISALVSAIYFYIVRSLSNFGF
ncbi:MAG: hypothetical protein A3B91_03375 [Candidatus Yanofskybacteria bacterium RIFCSPHIGHO2_02_FULL_41_29]|uniref:Uncharacterized protein n=1 Tax=Candidatus Yanofskybacteria bacterium RIFCSPHIGHO2_01_FULL_41_53 TaxID=1802663 RepID=A0A1F8EGQ1_9BACT|nr:MAG: hypothetical protein A2650_01200 [Candidatus Yanofskybacteria bacterium RIFCSPHIGHO2_01_FULL_41_53]OGN10702.1 MAG: hypothetical protein A3B91_03375 [Candidatus Yanofskybacteria bacterium RIFCSPHIGHO2_02_FULL_41_29]OGN18783.1 MAG: hypothetical protein A3F48_02435 [Candidatus Yanofskybacteria bacterium RIFCSPHIGHO2_12_FULL_41_9]OGN24040.1 MAG: hypothetical protein A2916_04755 [Candidatus Yanofskybacteria bacterium RIFCSPLOWO2_01_FULL_41_67]OGN30500.1 MAG: hypothetical protein A3H54_00545 